MAEAELTPKEVGGFRILRRLASGAASDVLLARAEGPHGFQRVVALKVLLAKAKADPDFERHFAAEASAYARLSHPAVVKLYDFFAADGQLVMVLEFVDGLPLHKLRAMLAIAGERIDDKAALFLGLRIFSALAAAHGARDPATGEFAPIAHADVNPSNILVPWDGHVKLGDFGIARAAGLESDARSGFIKGTYGYSAPEQVSGKEATVRSDVYSAGLIVWELLARRKAVQRGTLSDAQVLKAMMQPEFPALELLRPDLDAGIRGAIRRALEPDPDKRSITAEEVVNVLRQGVSAEEGRKSLADALMRVRSTGAADPLAATTQGPANTDADGPVSAPASAPSSGPLDSEQTAQFPAATEDQGDLGKIAFYGRLNLPTGSDPPGPVSVRGRSLQPAVAEAKTVQNVPSPVALPAAPVPVPAASVTEVISVATPAAALRPAAPSAAPDRRNDAKTVRLPPSPARPAPPTPAPSPIATPALGSRGKIVPRPILDARNVSNYPTVPAPPLVPDDDDGPRLVAAGAPPPMRNPPSNGPNTPPTPPVAAGAMPTTPGFSVSAPPASSGTLQGPIPKLVAPATPVVLAAPATMAALATEAAPEALGLPATPARTSAEPAAASVVPEPAPAPAPAPALEAPAAASPGGAPSTERSPEGSNPPPLLTAEDAVDRPVDEVAAASPAVAFGARPNEPPYVPSALPEARRSRGSTWLIAAAFGVLLAAVGAFVLLRGDAPVANRTDPAPTTASAPAAPADVTPPAPTASNQATPSTASAASAAPSASTPAPSVSSSPVASGSAARAGSTRTPAPVAPPPAAAPAAASEPADSGEVDLPASADGHRIFVDDKVAGEGTAPIHVHCGAHVIRIGSAGKERKVDVPCGRSVTLTP